MFMLEIKICIKGIGVQHSLDKNETATMFFEKPFLVYNLLDTSFAHQFLGESLLNL